MAQAVFLILLTSHAEASSKKEMIKKKFAFGSWESAVQRWDHRVLWVWLCWHDTFNHFLSLTDETPQQEHEAECPLQAKTLIERLNKAKVVSYQRNSTANTKFAGDAVEGLWQTCAETIRPLKPPKRPNLQSQQIKSPAWDLW